jgi:PilZ domain-containing protein
VTQDMAFECLLVSGDFQIFGTISRILRSLSICTRVCLSPSKALNLLREGETDLIVIDWEDSGPASELLGAIGQSSRKQKPTIVAISALDRPIPGAHVVLHKPVTAESGLDSLKAAYCRMVQEHRRHTRYALMTSVKAKAENDRTVPLTVTDIGDGGVGLRTTEKLATGNLLSFHLPLPGAKKEIYLEARVLWTREYGAVGCEFVRIPPVDLQVLHGWLKSKSQIKKPLIKVCGN